MSLVSDLFFFVFESYFIYTILVLSIFGVIYNKRTVTLNVKLVEIILKLSLISSFWLIFVFLNYGFEGYFFNFEVKKDSLSSFIIFLLLMGLALNLLISFDYLRKDTVSSFEYCILLLLAVFGLVIVTTSNDFLVLYLGIELQSLCLYVLAAFKQNSLYSTEAGLKYFVLGSFSSGILLFGMGFIYGLTGLISYNDLYFFFYSTDFSYFLNIGLQLGIILFLIGLFFKVGAAPFHLWLPDVYAGSPSIITSFFATTPKIVFFFLIGKFYFFVFAGVINQVNFFVLSLGLLSLIVGSLGALQQNKIKRLVAYSSISHAGFILLGLGSSSLENFGGVLFYILVYMLMSINFFSIFISLRSYTNFEMIRSLNIFSNIYRSNLVLGVLLAVVLFSLAGIPPLIGFFSKLYIFLGLIKGEYFFISIIAIFISVIGVVYYIRLIKLLFFENSQFYAFYTPILRLHSYIIIFSSFFILFACIFSSTILVGLHNLVLLYNF